MPGTGNGPQTVAGCLQLSVNLHHDDTSVEIKNEQIGSVAAFKCKITVLYMCETANR
jgi:hypothetical protein